MMLKNNIPNYKYTNMTIININIIDLTKINMINLDLFFGAFTIYYIISTVLILCIFITIMTYKIIKFKLSFCDNFTYFIYIYKYTNIKYNIYLWLRIRIFIVKIYNINIPLCIDIINIIPYIIYILYNKNNNKKFNINIIYPGIDYIYPDKKIINSPNNPNNKFIVFTDSPYAIKSRKILNTIYNYSKINYPDLYKYLTDNCSHLLNKPIGHTGILKSFFNNNNFDKLATNLTQTIPDTIKKIPKDTGIYAFKFNVSASGPYDIKNNYYIGSSINVINRLKQHYNDINSNKSNTVFYKAIRQIGIECFSWALVTVTKNYRKDFILNYFNPDITDQYKKEIDFILYHFTTYEIRIYEQSVIDYIKPIYNTTPVSFLNNWTPLDVKKITRCVIATDGTTLYSFDSIRAASKHLNITRSTIGKIINTTMSVYSSVLDSQVKFYDPK